MVRPLISRLGVRALALPDPSRVKKRPVHSNGAHSEQLGQLPWSRQDGQPPPPTSEHLQNCVSQSGFRFPKCHTTVI